MYAFLPGIIAFVFYALGSFYLAQGLTTDKDNRGKVLLCGLIAAVPHFLSLFLLIRTAAGYDFGFFKIASLLCWTIAVIVLLSSLKKPLENLFLVLFPLAGISIILSMIPDSSYTPHSEYTEGVAAHILLAILAASIITIAALQAMFLAFQNYQLKHMQSLRVISHLPPLQTMEALLFEIVWVGLLLLSAVIITGILFMDDFFAQHLTQKTVLSIVAWVVFVTLLWGRHKMGWRGNTAIRWTLAGFAFLVLSYFGSKIILDLTY